MATRVSSAQPVGLRFEPTERWVRGELGGVTVVDSRRTCLVWEPRRVVPTYAFPAEDVRSDALHPSDTGDHRAHEQATAEFWDLVAGDRVVENGAWRYDDDDLAGHVAFSFRSLDVWYEEEERLMGHPRDPFKRLDLRRSSRHVRVEIDGETVADTRAPHLLFETGHPTRYYLPPADVRTDLLSPSETRTICAYKGEASYWSAVVGGREHPDIAWSYPDPLPDRADVRDLICFFDEKVVIEVDGARVEPPATQWSR